MKGVLQNHPVLIRVVGLSHGPAEGKADVKGAWNLELREDLALHHDGDGGDSMALQGFLDKLFWLHELNSSGGKICSAIILPSTSKCQQGLWVQTVPYALDSLVLGGI